MSVVSFLKESKGKVLDCISGEIEEPFTHWSFEKIIALHSLNKTNFICARVKTVDPENVSKDIYSYYSAHLLNKVLFKIQIKEEEKYLSRMSVFNPATNTEIIGDIQYFIISLHEKISTEIETNVEIKIDITSSPIETQSPLKAILEETDPIISVCVQGFKTNILLRYFLFFLILT